MIQRIGPPLVRAAIRHVPPRRRGIRLANELKRRVALTDPVRLSHEPSGMRLRCDLRDKLSFEIYYRGSVDRALESWMRGWLRPGDIYIDVGAHIGYLVSLAVECVGADGRIEAFEPNPETYAKFEAAVRDLGGEGPAIALHNAAVGAETGEATIHVPSGRHVHQTYLASLADGEGLTASTSVPVVRLDDLPLPRRARLLKIDTEGFEIQVLGGAQRLLAECDAVLIEINPNALARAGNSAAEVVQSLEAHGLAPHVPTADGGLRPVPVVTVASEFEDVVFVRP